MKKILFILLFLTFCTSSFISEQQIESEKNISVDDFLSSKKSEISYSDLENYTISEDEFMDEIEIEATTDDDIKDLIDILFETN